MRDYPFGPWAATLLPASATKLNALWSGRSSMRPLAGRSVSVVSHRGLYGLLTLAAIAMLMPSLHGRPVGWPEASNSARSSTASTATDATTFDDDDKAVMEFLQVYRLVPGQDLKLVEAPRPAGAEIWWKRKHPNHGNHPGQFGSMTFSWRDPDRLQDWSMTTAGGFTARDLPRYLKVDVYQHEIEGDPELLKTVVAGDWVFRDGVRDERMVAALNSILQRAVRLRINVTFRTVERDVVVVRGRYHYSPLPGRQQNEIDIYGKQLVKNSGAGGGGGSFPEFLKWVGEWIERPVVSEVEAPPKEQVSWYLHARSPFTEQIQREDHDEAAVLQHLHEQTGLSFTREKHPVRILFVERAK
jgi:hypothetical protein